MYYMDKLKVAFLDFWPEIKDENIFLPILQKHFQVEVTTLNPDVVIHSIFGGTRQSSSYKCKKILFIGENYRPQTYGSNYSISFDPHSDTNFRLPLWQFYLILNPKLKDILFGSRINHETFDCGGSFVVSNPSNFFRNAFYDKLSSPDSGIKFYSYGRYKTNSFELVRASEGRYWRDAKYEFFLKNKHKYAITFENNSYPYYCTEKLMDAFLAGSLPLYWGDPKVNEDWNKDAFINVGKLGQDNAYNLIKSMERDKKLFDEMYHQSIFTEEQKNRHILNMMQFEQWLINVIKK
jgi:alpha(1,3/1,4) fucosyltransferase